MTTYESEGVASASKSFSFYLSPDNRALIKFCASKADAVTIRGALGPKFIKGMRTTGFEAAVMFDREGWKLDPDEIDQPAWLDVQRRAGANRLLTAGRYVPWPKDDRDAALGCAREEVALANRLKATPLVAVDARWIAREPLMVAAVLNESERGAAVILVEPGDPLALPGAIGGLAILSAFVPNLFLLRADHGALGALAHGARHAALGLIPSHRHGTTPDRPGFGKPGDRTARLFVFSFADWFTASTISGWSLTEDRFACCSFSCCHGQRLERFLDEDLASDATRHNATVLAELADLVIRTPDDIQRSAFLDFCATAAGRYDPSGFNAPKDPKPQLTGWLLS